MTKNQLMQLCAQCKKKGSLPWLKQSVVAIELFSPRFFVSREHPGNVHVR